MKIIAGLGNPDKKYEYTRHNAGFMALNALAKQHGLTWKNNKKFNSLICATNEIILIKPQTFMNNSGRSIQAILSFYKLLPKKLKVLKIKNSDLSEVLTIIHDDFDIDLGKFKTSVNSRSAGHNGVQSIINYLKTKNFKRIRIGIKTSMSEKIPADKFVLQKFNEKEIKIINNIISEVVKELN